MKKTPSRLPWRKYSVSLVNSLQHRKKIMCTQDIVDVGVPEVAIPLASRDILIGYRNRAVLTTREPKGHFLQQTNTFFFFRYKTRLQRKKKNGVKEFF